MAGAVMDTEHGFARGLEGYVGAVARRLGVGLESCTLDPEPPASAYLALDWRLDRFPDLDVALLWDERRGWHVALESRTGEDLITLVYQGEGLLPEPAKVCRFLTDLRTGAHRMGQPVPPRLRLLPRDELATQLARYAEPVETV